MPFCVNFLGTVESFEENELYWEKHIKIPNEVFKEICINSSHKRVVCKLNNSFTFHCAMLPKKTFHYILLNKEICKKNNFTGNDNVSVSLCVDESKYGLPMSEEMEEVLYSDPEGNAFFHKLTPGKQRSMIHLVNKVKNTQGKIDKSFVILEHLKNNRGVLDFKLLQEDFKNFKTKFSL